MTPEKTFGIIVVDLETTGFTPPEHSVVEAAMCDVYAGSEDLAGDACDWRVGDWSSMLADPGRAIPPESSAIHHIVDEDCRGAQPWPEVVAAAAMGFGRQSIAIAAHNAKFERQWMDAVSIGRPWICTYKCALRLWPDAPAHSNQALRYWRNLPVDRGIADRAHRAGPDSYVTAHLLVDMLTHASVDKLVEWSAEPALLAKCHIGSWRGRKWSEIDDASFLHWILRRDFDEDVMHTAAFYLKQLDADRTPL